MDFAQRRLSIVLAAGLIGMLGGTIPATATTLPCSAFDGDSLASLIVSGTNPTGVTCTIGALQYTFGTFDSSIDTLNSGGSVISSVAGPSASVFTFNAVNSGFTLSASGGLSETASTAGEGVDEAVTLNYSVSDLDGLLYEANATGSTVSSTPTTTGTGTNVDEAQYNNLVCDNITCGNNVIQGGASSVNGVNSSYQREFGNPTFTPFANSPAESSEATIQVEAFYRGTASWNGAATAFTIDAEVPEPGSCALLTMGSPGFWCQASGRRPEGRLLPRRPVLSIFQLYLSSYQSLAKTRMQLPRSGVLPFGQDKSWPFKTPPRRFWPSRRNPPLFPHPIALQ
jgi:hypothetical protein